MTPPIDASVNHGHEANNFTPLRLLLASLVMLFHFKILTGQTQPYWPMVYPDFAVEGFYVISGFLIYESFDRNPDRRRFFIRRFFRLYPLYLCMIAVQTIVLLALQNGPGSNGPGSNGAWSLLREAATYFAVNAVFLNFLHNSIGDALAGSFDAGINPSLWTLKIEVAFYLLVPLVWRGVQRWRTKWLVAAFAAALLYTTLFRWTGHMTVAKQIPGAMAYFIIGILICIHRRSIDVPAPATLAAAALGMAGVTCIQMGIGPFAAEGWRVLFPFLVAPVIYALAFELPPLHMKRDLSYGVYLIHGPVIQTLFALALIRFSPASLAATVALVLVLALAAERLVERPFIGFGHLAAKRLTPSPTSSPTGRATKRPA